MAEGNGEQQSLQICQYNDKHKFTTLNAKFEHEPSCPNNPNRVSERDNPERER